MDPIFLAGLIVILIILLWYIIKPSAKPNSCTTDSDCSNGACMKSSSSPTGVCVNCSSCYNGTPPQSCANKNPIKCGGTKYCATSSSGAYCEDCPIKGTADKPCPLYCEIEGLCCPDKLIYTEKCHSACETCCPYKSSDPNVWKRCAGTVRIAG